MTSKNIHVDNNWLFAVYSRNIGTRDAKDTIGGILACAHQANDKCFGIKLTGNVVGSVEDSGVDTVGYSVPGHECGDYKNVVFRDNVAHSISGNGATIYRNASSPSQRNCIEASFFVAYKCNLVGIVSN